MSTHSITTMDWDQLAQVSGGGVFTSVVKIARQELARRLEVEQKLDRRDALVKTRTRPCS